MPAELENSSAMTASNSAGEASVSSGHHATPPLPPAPKKKRNLPGMPDPDAEVISLSPKTLMTTNRFVCEICNKGFQRDQNLQLHRRGHNLPWKLRQRNGKEIRKRVYVCPEQSCVHHDPTRALGDLTGIKKHFFRKHGEKKWKCDKCSKKYAVQSDWKAHSKTCGSREYRCDCGTLFSRRESFITHRAFCDALAEESTKTHTTAVTTTNSIRDDDIENEEEEVEEGLPVLIPMQIQSPPTEKQESEEAAGELQYIAPAADGSGGRSSSTSSTNGTSLFASLFSSATATAATELAGGASHDTLFSELIGVGSMNYPEPISLCLSTNAPNSNPYQFAAAPLPSPHMSATALLQKAAQMGVSGSGSSFLRGFGLAPSSSSAHQEDSNLQWGHHHSNLDPGLGLGLAYDDGNLMMGSSSSSFFGPRPATLDLLGLGIGIGIGPRGSATGGFSALISSISSSVAAAPSWDGEDRKPTIL